jgi:hypothetical protein
LTSIARTRHRGDHSIRQIRVIRGCLCNFPRNLAPDFLQYMAERPEMTSHDGMSKKAKTTNKMKLKYEEIKHYIRNNSAGAWLLCDGLGALRVGFHAHTGYHHCCI